VKVLKFEHIDNLPEEINNTENRKKKEKKEKKGLKHRQLGCYKKRGGEGQEKKPKG